MLWIRNKTANILGSLTHFLVLIIWQNIVTNVYFWWEDFVYTDRNAWTKLVHHGRYLLLYILYLFIVFIYKSCLCFLSLASFFLLCVVCFFGINIDGHIVTYSFLHKTRNVESPYLVKSWFCDLVLRPSEK